MKHVCDTRPFAFLLNIFTNFMKLQFLYLPQVGSKMEYYGILYEHLMLDNCDCPTYTYYVSSLTTEEVIYT